MPQTTDRQALIGLEKKFWQSMVDQDNDTAVGMLCDPAFMVGPHGTFQFDHATYRKMADEGPQVVTAFELGDVEVAFPTESTAVLSYDVKQTVAPRGQRGGQGGEQQTMHDTSTWVRAQDGSWRCIMHTEGPAQNGQQKAH